MAIEETRLYELDDQVTLTDTDKIVVDKLGNTEAKSSFMLSVWNYIATKITLVTDFIGLSDVPASYTNKAYHKLYVKSDESGLEFKGNQSDYDVVEAGELDDLYVEVSKTTGGDINANALITVSGLTAQTIRNTAIGVPPSTAKLVYYDLAGEELGTVEIGDIGGGGENIATNDLVFPDNSTTDFDGYKATFDNAELKIIADANTGSDIPFEITQANGTDSILKVLGNGQVIARGKNNLAFNTAFGENSLAGVTTGNSNTAYGYNAGSSLSTGADNTFLGINAGSINNSLQGVIIGSGAGQNATGGYSVVMGYNAGYAMTSSNNALIGAYAGNAVTSGGENVFVGFFAGNGVTTGSGNVIIGTDVAQPSSTANCIVLGKGAVANGNNQIVIGSTGTAVGNVEDIGTFTPTKKMTIKLNGVDYYIQLDPVV